MITDVTSDGKTVWVNTDKGDCIGRFSKRFGIDIHNGAEVVMETGKQCLFCLHGEGATWELFIEKMQEHHGVEVPKNLLR